MVHQLNFWLMQVTFIEKLVENMCAYGWNYPNELISFSCSVHTMEELKLTGNHLKGSRPLLTFSANFDKEPHWMLLKELMLQVT